MGFVLGYEQWVAICPTPSVVWVSVPVVVGVESGGAMEIKLGLMWLIEGFNG